MPNSTTPYMDHPHNPVRCSDILFTGISRREHAAIALRIPESGNSELDAMIRKAQRRDLAAQVLAGMMARDYHGQQEPPMDYLKMWAVDQADDLLAILSTHPEGGAA